MATNRNDALRNLVSANAGAVDNPGTSAPSELSENELVTQVARFSETDRAERQSVTNNAEFTKLLASRPHTAAYIRDVMGINTAEVTTDGEFKGQEFNIFVPDKPRVGYDGYQIVMPDKSVKNIKKAEIKKWILSNALGRIAGGTSGKALQLISRNSKKAGIGGGSSVVVKPIGVDASNPEDYIETFEPQVDPATNEPLRKDVQVSLDKQVPATKKDGQTDEKMVRARGLVKGFPVWKRKDAFLQDLGPLKQVVTDAKQLRIETQESVEAAMREVLRMAHQEKITLL